MGDLGEEIDVVIVEPLVEPAPPPAPPQPEPVREQEPAGAELAPDHSIPLIAWRCWWAQFDRSDKKGERPFLASLSDLGPDGRWPIGRGDVGSMLALTRNGRPGSPDVLCTQSPTPGGSARQHHT